MDNLFNDVLLTILERISVRKPSCFVGNFLKRNSATMELSTASPRYSRRSLLMVSPDVVFDDNDLCVKASLYNSIFFG